MLCCSTCARLTQELQARQQALLDAQAAPAPAPAPALAGNPGGSAATTAPNQAAPQQPRPAQEGGRQVGFAGEQAPTTVQPSGSSRTRLPTPYPKDLTPQQK